MTWGRRKGGRGGLLHVICQPRYPMQPSTALFASRPAPPPFTTPYAYSRAPPTAPPPLPQPLGDVWLVGKANRTGCLFRRSVSKSPPIKFLVLLVVQSLWPVLKNRERTASGGASSCMLVLMCGFHSRNSMNLRDADSGKILWQSDDDLFVPLSLLTPLGPRPMLSMMVDRWFVSC